MTERPPLSKGELEVARALWELRTASVREVHASLSVGREIDFSTVQTYLRRLESKGYVKAKLQGRVRMYSARVKPRTVIRETVDDLIERLFGGETMPLMRHLIEDRGISDDELAQLRSLLDSPEDPDSPEDEPTKLNGAATNR